LYFTDTKEIAWLLRWLRAAPARANDKATSAAKRSLWETESVKVTLELPDDLMRRIKLRAAHHNRKLKSEIAQLLDAGMASAPAAEAPKRAPKPVRLRGRKPLTLAEIESAIAAGHD